MSNRNTPARLRVGVPIASVFTGVGLRSLGRVNTFTPLASPLRQLSNTGCPTLIFPKPRRPGLEALKLE